MSSASNSTHTLAYGARASSMQSTTRVFAWTTNTLHAFSRFLKSKQPSSRRFARSRDCVPGWARTRDPSRKTGGADRIRTDDPLLAKQMLSQLSYSPAPVSAIGAGEASMVGLDGFEPSTPALSRRCSNQLSYRPPPVTRRRSAIARRGARAACASLAPRPKPDEEQPIGCGHWRDSLL